MRDFDRLDKGFVNWQGQRLFVPMFGKPRIVPTAESEVQILTLKFRMYGTLAAYLAALVVAALALSDQVRMGAFVLGVIVFVYGIPAVPIIFGIFQRRCYGQWPLYSTVRSARSRFMISYFRSRPIVERASELVWSLLAVLVFGPLLAQAGERLLSSPAKFPVWLKLAFLGPIIALLAIAIFLAARLAIVTALALAPRSGWLAKPAR